MLLKCDFRMIFGRKMFYLWVAEMRSAREVTLSLDVDV